MLDLEVYLIAYFKVWSQFFSVEGLQNGIWTSVIMAGNWIWSTWMWVTYFTTVLSDLMMIIKSYSKDTIDTFRTFFASPSDDRMVSIARCMSWCSTSSRTFSIRDLFSLLLINTISYYMYSNFPLACSTSIPTNCMKYMHNGDLMSAYQCTYFVCKLKLDFDEIGIGESALTVAGNIYIWSVWGEYNDTF